MPDKHLFSSLKKLIKSENSLLVKPAHSQLVREVHINQFMPIGDALVSFDPLSGIGVVRAIQTASGLARILNQYESLTPKICQLFLDQIHFLYQDYLRQWNQMYTSVKKWEDAAFWKSRHEKLVEPAHSF